VEVTEACRAGE